MRNAKRSSIRLASTADRSADMEYAGICVGWEFGAGTGGGSGGIVHSGSGIGARVCEAGRDDGGEICSGSVWCGGDADVPDGGLGAVAWGREPGIFGTDGPSSEDSRIPDRVGRDRGGTSPPSRCRSGHSDSAGGRAWGKAAGGIRRSHKEGTSFTSARVLAFSGRAFSI